MPLPALLLPFVPVLAAGLAYLAEEVAQDTLQHLINPPPAGGTYDEDCLAQGGTPVFASDGEYIACDFPADPVPDTPSAPVIPPISQPPRQHYTDPYIPPEPTPPNDPPPPEPLPIIPPRRLPEPTTPVDTTSTPTLPPGKTTKVKLPRNYLALGDLLHEPITRSPVKIRVAYADSTIKSTFKDKQKVAATKFLLWLIAKDNKDLLEEVLKSFSEIVPTNINELGFVLLNRQIKGDSSPKTFAVFGCQTIAELMNDYSRRNYADFSKVGGIIPLDYTIEQVAAPVIGSQSLLKNLTVGTSATQNNASSTTPASNLLLEKIANAIGVDEFPAKLPKRLIYPNAKGEEEVNSIAEALGYQVKQIDKAVGYLPQKIKVLDTNAAMAGNQSIEVDIHSFADFARETLQYLIDTESDDDTLANIAVRILYECGAIHQAVVQGDAMLDAIVEHMDFKEKWEEIKVPFSFDPYAGQKGKKAGFDPNAQPLPLTEQELEKLLPDLLKETMVKIRILKNDQKRTMNDILLEIMKEARSAAAGVTEPATGKRIEELVKAAQAALQLQNAIARNNVRKGLAAGDMRTRKKPK